MCVIHQRLLGAARKQPTLQQIIQTLSSPPPADTHSTALLRPVSPPSSLPVAAEHVKVGVSVGNLAFVNSAEAAESCQVLVNFGRAAKMPFRKCFAYEANYQSKKKKKS